MGTIKVDFIKVEYHFFKSPTHSRIKFEENYDVSMLPQKGSLMVIGDKTYIVEQLTYFPFGDSEGQIGVRVYLN
jgi:hypothetical protein